MKAKHQKRDRSILVKRTFICRKIFNTNFKFVSGKNLTFTKREPKKIGSWKMILVHKKLPLTLKERFCYLPIVFWNVCLFVCQTFQICNCGQMHTWPADLTWLFFSIKIYSRCLCTYCDVDFVNCRKLIVIVKPFCTVAVPQNRHPNPTSYGVCWR